MENQQLRHFKDRYFISDDGYLYSELKHAPLRSHQSTHNKYLINGKWYMRLQLSYNNSKGYGRIKLSIGSFSIARLVAKIYIPNTDNLPQVNHKDGNKKNNHMSNLEWVTNIQNLKHAQELGLKKKIDYEKVTCLLEDSMLSQVEIANDCGCSLATVEKHVMKCKVQRPECYKASVKMNETRSKLVGSKWNRNGGSMQ